MAILAIIDTPDSSQYFLQETENDICDIVQLGSLNDSLGVKSNNFDSMSFYNFYFSLSDYLVNNTKVDFIAIFPSTNDVINGWADNLSEEQIACCCFSQWYRLSQNQLHEIVLPRNGRELNQDVEPVVIRPGQVVIPAKFFSREFHEKARLSASKYVPEFWIQMTAFAKLCGVKLKAFETHNDAVFSDQPYRVLGKIRNVFPLLSHHNLIVETRSFDPSEVFTEAFFDEAQVEFNLAKERLKQCELLSITTSKDNKADHQENGVNKTALPSDKSITELNFAKEKISVCLTSFPDRFEKLELVIRQIEENVDDIYLHLNATDAPPSFFVNHPKIKLSYGTDYNATGKTRFVEEITCGYVFTIDDDNIIPNDYFSKTIEKLNSYRNKVAITYHGSVLKENGQWYFEKHSLYGYQQELADDRLVNLCGSGFLAFHSSVLSLTFDDFLPYTMVDLIFSLKLREAKVPIICAARSAFWLRLQSMDSTGLWHTYKDIVTMHSLVYQSEGNWASENYENKNPNFPGAKNDDQKYYGWDNKTGNVSLVTARQNFEFQTKLLIQFYETLMDLGVIKETTKINLHKGNLEEKDFEISKIKNSLEFKIGIELSKFGNNRTLSQFAVSGAKTIRLLVFYLSRKLFPSSEDVRLDN